MTEPGEVDADLVRAAGLERAHATSVAPGERLDRRRRA